jgi:hypothetical protein
MNRLEFEGYEEGTGEWYIDTSSDFKRVFIRGPMDGEMEIDYDDVDHNQVAMEIIVLVEILRKYWPVIIPRAPYDFGYKEPSNDRP